MQCSHHTLRINRRTLKVNCSKGNSQIGLKYKLESVINPVIKFRKLAFLPTFLVREQVVCILSPPVIGHVKTFETLDISTDGVGNSFNATGNFLQLFIKQYQQSHSYFL